MNGRGPHNKALPGILFAEVSFGFDEKCGQFIADFCSQFGIGRNCNLELV